MSHLGDRLSALIDGELSHDERDRLHVHLAMCAQCRAEAVALRALKRRVAKLGDTTMDPVVLRRLLAMAEPGIPIPARSRSFVSARAPRPALRLYRDTHQGAPPAGRPARAFRWPVPAPGRRGRFVAAGVASLLVVAVGGISFAAGGTSGSPGPRVTPPVDMFTVEHSVTTGEVPLVSPAATLLPARTAGGP